MHYSIDDLVNGILALLAGDHPRCVHPRRRGGGLLHSRRARRGMLGALPPTLAVEGEAVSGNQWQRAQGRAAQRVGRSFEDDIEATNRAYSQLGVATMARAHPPVGGPPTALFYRGKGQVDFLGTVCGVPVAFDAKSDEGCASYKYYADDMHELDFLLDWRAKGGIAFVLLLDRERDTLYLIEHLASLRAGKSVPLRTHVRAKSAAQALVPALVRTESARTLDAALSRPVWPWIELAKLHEPRLAAAIAQRSA